MTLTTVIKNEVTNTLFTIYKTLCNLIQKKPFNRNLPLKYLPIEVLIKNVSSDDQFNMRMTPLSIL